MKTLQTNPGSALQSIPATVWVLGFVSMFMDMGSGVIYSLLPLFLVSILEIDILTIGLIEGAAEVATAFAKAFSGTLSDYWRQRKGLALLGYGLSAFSKPLFSWVTSPIWVLLVYFGDRIGKGIRVAPRDALIADTTPAEQRGAAYGLRQSLDTVGAYLGPLAASALMISTAQDFRFAFRLTLIPGIIAVILLAVGIREPEQIAPSQTRSNPFTWEALGKLGRGYWLLVVVAFLASLGNSSNAFLLLRAGQVGVATAAIPLTLVVMNVAYSLSAYPAGVISDRLGRVGILFGGFLLYSLVYMGFAFANVPWQIWVLFVFYGIYLGISKGVMPALIADVVPSDLRGTAFGLLNFVMGIALFIASFLAGALWQGMGSKATFIVGSTLTLVSALVLLIRERFLSPVIPDLKDASTTSDELADSTDPKEDNSKTEAFPK
jgi:MFS family permease